jgi:hypothetical protein
MGFGDIFKGKKKEMPVPLPEGGSAIPSMPEMPSAPDVAMAPLPAIGEEGLDAPPMPPPELTEAVEEIQPEINPSMVQEPTIEALDTMPQLPTFDNVPNPEQENFDLGSLPEFPQLHAEEPVAQVPQFAEPEMPAGEPTEFEEPIEFEEPVPLSDIEGIAPAGEDTEGMSMEVDSARADLTHFKTHDNVNAPFFVGVENFRVILHHLGYMQDDALECLSYYEQYNSLKNVMNESYDKLQDSLMQTHKKLMLMDKILFGRG